MKINLLKILHIAEKKIGVYTTLYTHGYPQRIRLQRRPEMTNQRFNWVFLEYSLVKGLFYGLAKKETSLQFKETV